MEHRDFSSPRLTMELITQKHAIRAFGVVRDENLYTYLPEKPPSLAELEKRYAFWECRDSPDGTEYWLNWAVVHRISQQLIGTVQLGIHKEKKEGAIAYMIGSEFQGQGYGTEAVKASLEHGKKHYGVQVFKAWIDTRNKPSIRLVQKLGMEQVSLIEKADHFDGEDSDEFVFQLECKELKIS